MATWLIYEMCTKYMFHEFGIKRAPPNYLPNLSDIILTVLSWLIIQAIKDFKRTLVTSVRKMNIRNISNIHNIGLQLI